MDKESLVPQPILLPIPNAEKFVEFSKDVFRAKKIIETAIEKANHAKPSIVNLGSNIQSNAVTSRNGNPNICDEELGFIYRSISKWCAGTDESFESTIPSLIDSAAFILLCFPEDSEMRQMIGTIVSIFGCSLEDLDTILQRTKDGYSVDFVRLYGDSNVRDDVKTLMKSRFGLDDRIVDDAMRIEAESPVKPEESA